MRRIRVAHVITRLCKGGAQENTFHTVRLADRGRFDVDLISGHATGPEGSLEPEIAAAGIPILRVPHLVRQISPLHDQRALSHLTRLFRQNRYDIVHTHTSKAGFLGRLAAKRAGVPIVVHTPHGNIYHGYFGWWPTRLFVHLERAAAQWTSRIVELTHAGIRESLAEGIGQPNQYTPIFSGIDLTPFGHAIAQRGITRRALGLHNGAVLVGGVGRLEPIKGYTSLVDAAKSIAAEYPQTRFALAGQGSLESDLRARANGLGHTFQLLGLRHDVPNLMAAFDILAVPSLNEGMGRVILEAAAAGTPVIATRVGGIPEVVEDGQTGILTPPNDPAALAQAIRALIRDPERRRAMGEAARTRIAPRFGLQQMVMRIEQLYEELIEEKNLDP